MTNISDLRGGDGDGVPVGIIAGPKPEGCRPELIIGGEPTVVDRQVFLTPYKGISDDKLLIGETQRHIRGEYCHLPVNDLIHTPKLRQTFKIYKGGSYQQCLVVQKNMCTFRVVREGVLYHPPIYSKAST